MRRPRLPVKIGLARSARSRQSFVYLVLQVSFRPEVYRNNANQLAFESSRSVLEPTQPNIYTVVQLFFSICAASLVPKIWLHIYLFIFKLAVNSCSIPVYLVHCNLTKGLLGDR